MQVYIQKKKYKRITPKIHIFLLTVDRESKISRNCIHTHTYIYIYIYIYVYTYITARCFISFSKDYTNFYVIGNVEVRILQNRFQIRWKQNEIRNYSCDAISSRWVEESSVQILIHKIVCHGRNLMHKLPSKKLARRSSSRYPGGMNWRIADPSSIQW